MFTLIFLVVIPGYTRDSLGHWESIYSNPIYGLYAIDFVDSLYGWTVGDFGLVLRTEDGGESWDTIYAPVPNTWGYSLNDVYFFNRDIGWVCGDSGCIDKTLDGGDTWEVQNTGTLKDIYTIDFLDSLYGWAGGVNDSFLYKTTDGGDTWTKVPFLGDYTSQIVSSISIVSKNTIWVLMLYGALTYKTTDGGNTWNLKLSGNNYGDCLETFDSQYVWVASEGSPNSIYRSSDGGNTWEETTGCPSLALCFVDSLYGWAGGGFEIYFTFDGGRTFHSSASPPYWVSEIDFVDRDHGWCSLYYPGDPANSGDVGKWFPDTSGISEEVTDEGKEDKTVLLYSNQVSLGEGRFKIFDSSGRIIKVAEKIWNGSDFSNSEVSPGVYFARKKSRILKIIKIR